MSRLLRRMLRNRVLAPSSGGGGGGDDFDSHTPFAASVPSGLTLISDKLFTTNSGDDFGDGWDRDGWNNVGTADFAGAPNGQSRALAVRFPAGVTGGTGPTSGGDLLMPWGGSTTFTRFYKESTFYLPSGFEINSLGMKHLLMQGNAGPGSYLNYVPHRDTGTRLGPVELVWVSQTPVSPFNYVGNINGFSLYGDQYEILRDTWYCIEVLLTCSSSPSAGDGSVEQWITPWLGSAWGTRIKCMEYLGNAGTNQSGSSYSNLTRFNFYYGGEANAPTTSDGYVYIDRCRIAAGA